MHIETVRTDFSAPAPQRRQAAADGLAGSHAHPTPSRQDPCAPAVDGTLFSGLRPDRAETKNRRSWPASRLVWESLSPRSNKAD